MVDVLFSVSGGIFFDSFVGAGAFVVCGGGSVVLNGRPMVGGLCGTIPVLTEVGLIDVPPPSFGVFGLFGVSVVSRLCVVVTGVSFFVVASVQGVVFCVGSETVFSANGFGFLTFKSVLSLVGSVGGVCEVGVVFGVGG